MKNGQIVKTFIGQVAEGVNDVKAQFTKTGEHVLYYHSGQQTLRAHRMSDGLLVGTFRPHSRITTWTSDESGQMIVIGGQDGSLLTSFLYDLKIYPDSQRNLAQLPSRRYLAEHLNIPVRNNGKVILKFIQIRLTRQTRVITVTSEILLFLQKLYKSLKT